MRTDFLICDITLDAAIDVIKSVNAFLKNDFNSSQPYHDEWDSRGQIFSFYYPADLDQIAVEKFLFKLKLKYPDLIILSNHHIYTLRE